MLDTDCIYVLQCPNTRKVYKMSGLTYEEQTSVRDSIKAYLEDNGMTSLRKIAVHVEAETGISPSPSTIARLVREFGYEITTTQWKKVSV